MGRVNARKLIYYLRSFNSKERYYLIQQVFGVDYLSSFIECLNSKIEPKIPELNFPDEAFCAMDYHLDWIYASICLSSGNKQGPFDNSASYSYNDSEKYFIQGNQEDIDLIIAYCKNDKCHLIFIEAKGITDWDKKQMASKSARLKALFGDEGVKQEGIVPRFIIMSPTEPSPDIFNNITFPKWMKPNETFLWVELAMPKKSELLKVTRWDYRGKKPSKIGMHWNILPR